VVITLAETPGVFQSIEIFEGDDAWTKIEFRDVELNPDLPDELFTDSP
jgi:outer membrane lipoprotein-sorting protein